MSDVLPVARVRSLDDKLERIAGGFHPCRLIPILYLPFSLAREVQSGSVVRMPTPALDAVPRRPTRQSEDAWILLHAVWRR